MLIALLGFALLQGTPKPDRIVGLLELPEIFGDEPCAIYPFNPIGVHTRPSNDSPLIGRIEVTKPWRLIAGMECETLEVRVLKPNASEDLPTLEIGYEAPAAVVYEQAGLWFRIRLQTGSGWVSVRDPAQFHSYAELVKSSLTHIREGWNGRFWAAPDAPSAANVPAAWLKYAGDEVTAEVFETRTVGGQLWLHLRLDPEYGCAQYPSTLPKVEGWLPAYGPSGDHSVWFSSRGC